MKAKIAALLTALIVIFFIWSPIMSSKADPEVEKKLIKEVIHNSIGWAKTKDTELSYSCFAKDSNLFFFNPDSSSLVGFENFKNLTETFFMDEAFKAIRYEIRELRVNLSRSGDVAWYSAFLDDENEWNGRPASWLNTRWTGVLEKRDGKWVIVQMHFSFASDK